MVKLIILYLYLYIKVLLNYAGFLIIKLYVVTVLIRLLKQELIYFIAF
jgi:hypothetical protein